MYYVFGVGAAQGSGSTIQNIIYSYQKELMRLKSPSLAVPELGTCTWHTNRCYCDNLILLGRLRPVALSDNQRKCRLTCAPASYAPRQWDGKWWTGYPLQSVVYLSQSINAAGKDPGIRESRIPS